MDTTDALSRHGLEVRPITVAEYQRMGEVGILGEDDRVELLEGLLTVMSPIGPRHALAIDALTELLVVAVHGRAKVRVQNPVTLDNGSEPTPDVTVVRTRWPGYPARHPGPDDVLLLVEVADSSIRVDLGAKRDIYARAGVGEYWVVDLTKDVVHVHRTPANGRFTDTRECDGGSTLALEAMPDVSVPAGQLFA